MPAIVRSAHPLPTVTVTIVAVVLAIAFGLDTLRIILVGAVILTNQLSIGLSNDWIDADRDRATQRADKPVATGELPRRTAAVIAIASAATSVLLSLPLGFPAAAAHAVFLAAGWLYNAGLKRTPLSFLAYLVGFAALPLFVGLASPSPFIVSPWVLVAGGLLGVAAHGANVLPDLDDDRRTGVRGLPHRIGVRATGALIAVSLVGASAAVAFGHGTPGVLAVVAFTAIVLIAATSAVLVWFRPPSVAVFRLILVAAVIVVAQLASSGH